MYIWEKYQTFEITSGIILKMKFPLYKGFTLEITNKWWPLTTLNRWPLYQIKIYSDRWPHWTGDRYIKLKYIVKCTGRARKWPLWAGDHNTKVTVTTGLTVYCFTNISSPFYFQFLFFTTKKKNNKVCFFSLFWFQWQIVLQHVRSFITLVSDWNHS